MKKIVSVVVLLIVAGTIFHFSSQTYEEQTLVPLLQHLLPGEPCARWLSYVKVYYWGQEISVEARGYYYFIEFFIRKFAHLFLFGCLAVALFYVYLLWRPDQVLEGGAAALAGTGVYAAFDELHQMQTGGRTPLLQDVLLDLTGAAIALLLFVPFYVWKRYKSGRR
ncbi:VanZ family protein [Bacillus sp. B190/17]|uniref:VanZ family protein n=1 Tax=Bacillus lumedeiriae TaxID=3058829 RepID=A0ABW8ICD0_9BACI